VCSRRLGGCDDQRGWGSVKRRMRILIVEDEPAAARFLEQGLLAEGFAVTSAGAAGAALAELQERTVGLVVLDLDLRAADGLELLGRITDAAPGVAVLLLSGRRDLATRLAGLRGGACDFVSKPYAFDELVARIRIHGRAHGDNGDGLVMKAHGLVLDTRERTVDTGGGKISLTALEYRLLEYMLRHRGSTISRQRLLSAVWGYSHEPNTNVVDVSMRRLRLKIGRERIETIRSAGYRLSD
jgi:two-component system copper resistance phosphate regulon response regulator CusR